MIATHAALPMYDFPEIAQAHDRLWRTIVRHARDAGLSGAVPLIQICGYPLIRSLSDVYDVVGAPHYSLWPCEEATHRAVIVVASAAKYGCLEDLRDTCFAINTLDSNTGMNLPRRLVAPLARAGRFFRKTLVTGSHATSLAAVASGHADAASIDGVTFALLAEHRPRAVAGVRVLVESGPSPTPPFVTPRATGPHVRALLYDALAAAIDDSELAGVRRALHLASITPATLTTYDVVAKYETEAVALGYATLA